MVARGPGDLRRDLARHADRHLVASFGVFHFSLPGPLIPLWLMVLWAPLGTTLRHCLAWSARPWWRASLLGAVGGPLSYYAGSQLAGVSFGYGTAPTVIGLALLWGLSFPSCIGSPESWDTDVCQSIHTLLIGLPYTARL